MARESTTHILGKMLQIQGLVQVGAPQWQVWRQITDPQQLGLCTSGLEAWRALDESNKRFELIFTRRLNQKRIMRIPVVVEWQEIQPPQQMKLFFSMEVRNMLIEAEGRMELSPASEVETKLAFFLKFMAENKLLLQMAANSAPKMVDEFFICIKARLETAVSATPSQNGSIKQLPISPPMPDATNSRQS